jgi:hypothetical protein
MEVKVDLEYDGGKTKPLTVTVKDGLKGQRFFNAVEKAVEKAAADDKEWRRWNLIDAK